MKLENAKEVITVSNADITGSSFSNVNAQEVTIQCANLTGVSLKDVNLTGMNISDANLSNLLIDGAQWGGARFTHIGFADKDQPETGEQKLEPLQFIHCSLKQGVFTDCDLTNVKIENCDITGLVINGVNIAELIKQQSDVI